MHTSLDNYYAINTAPASPPQNVVATVLSSTKIQVNWTEVAEIDQNGNITEYEVMYEPLMIFGVLNTATTTTMNLFTVLFGLEEYVEYNISVRAYTNDGAGPYSVGIVKRTFEDGRLTMDISHLLYGAKFFT